MKAYGYTADPKKAGEITKSQLVADSKKYYSGIYDRYMMTMQLIGDRAWTAKKKAYDYAQRRTAIYILQLAGSAADYREICGECGIGEDVMNSVYKEFKGDGENANGDGTSGNRLTVPHAIMK